MTRAGEHLGVSRNGLLGPICVGVLNEHQVTDFAPWQIDKAELDSAQVQALVAHFKKFGRLPAEQGCSARLQGLLLPAANGDSTGPA